MSKLDDGWDDPRAAEEPSYRPYRRSRAVWRLSLLAILGLVGSGVGGYYAWQFYDQKAEADEELKTKRTAAATCGDQLGQLKAQHDELNRQVVTCQTAKSGTESKKREVEGMMTAMEANLSATRDELETLRKQRAETEKRLGAFKDLTAKFQKMIDSGKIEVKIRNGAMLVAMPAQVLFPSGSAALSRPGELSVMEVGVIFKQFPKRRFMVVGHTDNQRVKGPTYKDNWELSTARAVTVTKFLVSAGLNAKSLLAAGHGEHDPVASNKSKQGRERNRRIEIILLPDLDELPPMPAEVTGDKKGGAGKSKSKAKGKGKNKGQ